MSEAYRWEKLSSEEVDRNKFWAHWRDTFRTPRGRTGPYDYTVHHDAVNVVGRLDDGRFVMIREYRYLFDRMTLSVAQGGMEPGEDPSACAHREFQEETGYKAERMTELGVLWSAPAFSKERFFVFLAEGLSPAERLDNEEIEEVIVMSKEEVEAAMRTGEFADSHGIAAWQMAMVYLERGSTG